MQDVTTKGPDPAGVPGEKFSDPDRTVSGEPRASVRLRHLTTLWINTGTLCNIECRNCYILSSPTNDSLVYMSRREAAAFLKEAAAAGTRDIGFTGGEPFLNPDMLDMLADSLAAGFEVLVLTNAMAPMQRPHIRDGLIDLKQRYGARLTLRVSLDHYSAVRHDEERGSGAFIKTVAGMDWLSREGFAMAIAGRSLWGESDAVSRQGYAELIADKGWPINPQDRKQLMLLPEMDAGYDGPEITTACWGILNINPDDMMCATSRMVVKRKGADQPTVLPCTLLPYDAAFDMGATLSEAHAADGGMFDDGAVKLCHPHCAKFCVLGGGSCS